MSLDKLWTIYQNHGYEGLEARSAANARQAFYLALLAFGEQYLDQAAEYAQQAKNLEPHNLVFVEATTYLHRILQASKSQNPEDGVYVTGEAFSLFIREGGNVPLYEATSAALQGVYQQHQKVKLLDIGVGEGRSLLPALTDNIQHVDILEPSQALLREAEAALAEGHISHQAICSTLQQFAKEQTGVWDIIEATYSLQSLAKNERPAVFRWLRENTKRLLIAEFDVPEFAEIYSPQRVQHIINRYKNGLAEYQTRGSVVAQGFLMPVMFGYFDQTAARINHEQPIKSWIGELKEAGFQTIETQLLYNYWWAPAYLIDAR